jgi:hypothetical protein
MSRRLLAAIVFCFIAPVALSGEDVHVRGALVWTDEKQTITDCTSGRVYWVRVLASNPHFLLTKRVDELASKGAENIVAEFHGEVNTGVPSVGPGYFVDGTLSVHQILSVAPGRCEKPKSERRN